MDKHATQDIYMEKIHSYSNYCFYEGDGLYNNVTQHKFSAEVSTLLQNAQCTPQQDRFIFKINFRV